MFDNWYIAIEGAIGAGKSSLAGILAKEMNGFLVPEPYETNPFLEKFYENPRKYRFQAQLFFLLTRYQQQKEIFEQLLSQNVVTDYYFPRDHIFADLNLSGDDLKIYKKVYRSLSRKLPKPDLIIYLQAPLKLLEDNIQRRNRSFEKTLQAEYLQKVCIAFDRFFSDLSDTPCLVLHPEEINQLKEKNNLNQFIEKIKSQILNTDDLVEKIDTQLEELGEELSKFEEELPELMQKLEKGTEETMKELEQLVEEPIEL